MGLFKTRNKESQFIGWDDYTNRMAVLELHAWQQETRNKSLANASSL